MNPIKFFLLLSATLLTAGGASAFCGFYVAKADAKLFNKSSQVIIVRDGNKTVITMANDFQGEVRDFAMVVPVPQVLDREDIRVAERVVFDKLDAYSAPRLVEYYDANPCYQYMMEDRMMNNIPSAAEGAGSKTKFDQAKSLGVTIEAKYTVGEYDILILSATQSSGLETWLTDNGYKIPAGAKEVLQPYIKSNLKFFVVKVNLDNFESSGFSELRPLQIAFTSEKFMLPIRLGMANAEGNQDLIIYAFTRGGRVETANYRTAKLPSDKNIPVFVKNEFGRFFKDLFRHSWRKEYGKAVFLEYSWDLSSSNFVKCDPCATTPPVYSDLREAGVFWVTGKQQNWGGSDYDGNLFMTRLHVRYNRANYPQDLVFMQTPNKESFQGRYIVTHAVEGDLDCEEAQAYYKGVVDRRQKELTMLASLTGWNTAQYSSYVDDFSAKIKDDDANGWIDNDFDENSFFLPGKPGGNRPGGGMMILVLITGISIAAGVNRFLPWLRMI